MRERSLPDIPYDLSLWITWKSKSPKAINQQPDKDIPFTNYSERTQINEEEIKSVKKSV